jgi:hypothetical protein
MKTERDKIKKDKRITKPKKERKNLRPGRKSDPSYKKFM